MGYFAENFYYILEKVDAKETAKDIASVAAFGGASPVYLASQYFLHDDINKLVYHKESNGKDYKGAGAFQKAYNDYCSSKKENGIKEYLKWMPHRDTDIRNKCNAASKKGIFDLNKVFNL